MTREQEYEPDDGEATDTFAAVDATIVAARDVVEQTKAVIDETHRLLKESRDLIHPIKLA